MKCELRFTMCLCVRQNLYNKKLEKKFICDIKISRENCNKNLP